MYPGIEICYINYSDILYGVIENRLSPINTPFSFSLSSVFDKKLSKTLDICFESAMAGV